ncbi:hypothetical protein MMC28_007084 [Mycoblastus sanguinarius]|nr:hypothetical protein [Mycoblastus sanguinarius]
MHYGVFSSSSTATPFEISYWTPNPSLEHSYMLGPQEPWLLARVPDPLLPLVPYEPRSLPTGQTTVLDPYSTPPPFWQNYKLDALLDCPANRTDTINLEQTSDNWHSTMEFCTALDWLGELIGLGLPSEIQTKSSCVPFSLSESFFGDVMVQMRESLLDHCMQFGKRHRQTLQNMARLGYFYKLREQLRPAENLLRHAKMGFEVLYSSNTEEFFHNTRDIIDNLIDVYKRRGEFEKCELELVFMIRRLEPLSENHRLEIITIKHRLSHLYIDMWPGFLSQSFAQSPVLFQYVEKMLLDDIQHAEQKPVIGEFGLCAFELLRKYYHSRDDNESLPLYLDRIEDKIESLIVNKESMCLTANIKPA